MELRLGVDLLVRSASVIPDHFGKAADDIPGAFSLVALIADADPVDEDDASFREQGTVHQNLTVPEFVRCDIARCSNDKLRFIFGANQSQFVRLQ